MMSSACYSNRRRLLAIANDTKVQYQGGLAVNTNTLYSTINCNPNFSQVNYTLLCNCKPKNSK